MNFAGAVAAHIDWKARLKAYIIKNDGSLLSATVAADNQCELGRWIYSEGARLMALPGFEALKREHAKFHRCAADIVAAANAGHLDRALALLEGDTEYSRASTTVVAAIVRLSRAASLERPASYAAA
jgi:hypothetical protein